MEYLIDWVLYFNPFYLWRQDLTKKVVYGIIMKMKKRRIGLLLLAMPLLMANSPAPYPSSNSYKDIEASITKLHDYAYRLNVKNTGDYHLSRGNFYLYDNEGLLVEQINKPIENAIFKTQKIGPNESASYIIQYSTNGAKDLTIVEKITTEAYDIKDENVTYSTPTIKKEKSSDYANYYKINSKFSHLGDYYYIAAVSVTYKGEKYSFTTGTDSKAFVTNEELDLSQLTIENIAFYRSNYNTYKGGYVLAGIFYVIQYLPYVMLGLALIVPPAIIIPISVTKAKRRRRRQEQNKQ